MLTGHEPKEALRFFEEISRIPRRSGNERGISDYLVAFAEERGLWVRRDAALNVVIKKPGTAGLEKAPAVIVQGHMDMVCEKNEGTVHDFEKDPLKLLVDGDFLKADGTTLGADNGAAVAMALALLDARNIPHPPLEVLITTSEETGVMGAEQVDGGLFEGKMLLNLDSGEEGFFYASCAGGGDARLTLVPEYRDIPAGFVARTLSIRGLKGGHSGVDITKERGNANRLLGRALRILRVRCGILAVSLKGGSKENAIPREADAVIAVGREKEAELAGVVAEVAETFKREYAASDEGLELTLAAGPAGVKKAFSGEFLDRVLLILLALPNGVQAMNLAFDDLPETSLNIGVLAAEGDLLVVSCGIRSSVRSRREMLVDQISVIAEAAGAELAVSGLYPAWEYRERSVLREKAMRLFSGMFGREAAMLGTHGGLECGILSGKIEGVDIVSFGPDIREMHTPSERMSLSSFARTWEFLKKLLVELAS